MKRMQLNTSRFVVGLIVVCIAVLLLIFGKGEGTTTGAIALCVLGLISIAIARRS